MSQHRQRSTNTNTLIKGQGKRRRSWALPLAVCLVAVSGLLAIAIPKADAIFTAAQILVRIPNAQGTAAAPGTVPTWESDCTSHLASLYGNGDTVRNHISDPGSAYAQGVWISNAGNPVSTTGNFVFGTPSYPLQVNQVGFLCSIVTNVATGTDRPNPANMVTVSNFPNDRGPAAAGSVNAPLLGEQWQRIQTGTATSARGAGTVAGTVTSPTGGSIAGETLTYQRNSTTRYWFAAPEGFRFSPNPAAIDPGTGTAYSASGQHTIWVNITYTTIKFYTDGVYRCTLKSGVGANIASQNSWPLCKVFPDGFKYTYTIAAATPPPTATCTGVTPSGDIEVGAGGQTVKVAGVVSKVPATGTISVIFTSSSGVPQTLYSNPAINFTTSPAGGGLFNATFTTPVLPIINTAGTVVVSWSFTSPAAAVCPDGSFHVASKPYFKVYGGDILAGSGSGADCNSSDGLIAGFNEGAPSYAGSSTQLTASSLTTIIDVASAGTQLPYAPKTLTIANSGGATATEANSTYGGGSGLAQCITDYYGDAVTGLGAPHAVGATTIGGLSGFANSQGDVYITPVGPSTAVTITASLIPNATHMKVYVAGDVFITGAPGIAYSGANGWTKAADIPSLWIIASGNIYIDPGVTQLDGVYVAEPSSATKGGQIVTCATATGPEDATLLYANCHNQLTINGAFVADQVELLRTLGSLKDATPGEVSGASRSCTNGSGTTCAAEVFNYEPELYLALPPAATTGVSPYDAITSLPPVL